MKTAGWFTAAILLAVSIGAAQTAINDSAFSVWLDDDIDFVLFDVRGDAHIDSIVFPCFYTDDVPRWVDSLGCRKRILIICHGGIYAHTVAEEITADGYPEDSVFSSGFDELTSSRFPAADTMPTSLLRQSTTVPRPPTGPELRAILVGKRPYRLVDVRDEWETESGMIPGACVLPWYDNFRDEAVTLPLDELIIVYCHSGSRAHSAEDYLTENGFDSSNVINFGGFYRWYEYSLPNAYAPQEECGCPKKTQVAGSDNRVQSPEYIPAVNQPSVRSGTWLDLRGREISAHTHVPAPGVYLRTPSKGASEKRLSSPTVIP